MHSPLFVIFQALLLLLQSQTFGASILQNAKTNQTKRTRRYVCTLCADRLGAPPVGEQKNPI